MAVEDVIVKTIFFVLVFLISLLALYEGQPSTERQLFLYEIKDVSVLIKTSLIDRINKKNSKIKSLFSADAQVQISHVPFKLTAEMAYEKDRNFRMVVRSVMGKELDVGSNSDTFWFWSKRMNPPYLHYASYSDLYKCRLKDVFHPLWMMESLGINEINSNAVVKDSPKYLIISEKRRSTSNTIVIKVTLIDKKSEAIVGHYILNEGKVIVSAEVKEFHPNGIPKKIAIIWHEENVSLTWSLNEVRVNCKIDPYNWRMPYHKKSINMGKD